MNKKILAAILSLLVLFSLPSCSVSRGDDAEHILNVYYVNADSYELGGRYIEAVEYYLGDNEDPIYNALNYLTAPPEDNALISALVKGTRVYSYSLENGEISVTLSPAYLLLNDLEKASANCCITLTLCGIDEIDSVSIYVDDKLVEEKLDSSIMIVEDTDTNEFEKQISLYFPEKNYNYLQTEYRVLTVGQDKLLAEYVVEELIKSTQTPGLADSIPANTLLLSVEQKNGVCTVNLSREFVNNRIMSAAGQRMAVYSIVNSLTRLESIEKVCFLIEGEAASGYEYIDIGDSFTFFGDIIYEPQEASKLFATVYLYAGKSGKLVKTPVVIEKASELTDEENIVRYVLKLQKIGGYEEIIPYGLALIFVETVNGVCSITLESQMLAGDSAEKIKLAAYIIESSVVESGAAYSAEVTIDGKQYISEAAQYTEMIIE